ncbi:MAG: hypothetical protein JWN01_444 [Patescibacteria group bacterium]|nr:hypothetical protein [Patescibacteria group bacterium]
MKRRRHVSARRVFGRTITTLLMLASGVLTVYIFTNSYETAFDQDLPFATAVAKVDAKPFAPSVPKSAYAADPSKRIGGYGAPTTLRIASRQVKLPLAPAITTPNNTWEARSNTGHYLLLTTAKSGNLGDLLVYLRQGWRTIDDPSALTVDGNIFVDTDKGWRYMYRITTVSHMEAKTGQYLLPESRQGQLLLDLEDTTTGTITTAKAEFVSLQNIGQ